MRTWAELIAEWHQHMETDTGLAEITVAAYENDALTWAAWAEAAGIYGPDQVAASDVKEYRDARESGAGKAPASANRRLTSLALLLDFCGRQEDNPARRVRHIQEGELQEDGRALDRLEWNRVRRQAELAGPLADALAKLFRQTGVRVGEVAPREASRPVPLLLGDLTVSPRKGDLRIRNGKGRKQRIVPIALEARDALQAYMVGERRGRLDAWASRLGWTEKQRAWWDSDQAPVFLGERGPLTVRGIRHIIAGLGEAAGLDYPLGPHDLRATFATALLDPAKYGSTDAPVPITVVKELMGHASIETTARYARPSMGDLQRWMNGVAGD